MPTITLDNIPDDLYRLLKQSAERNHRSIENKVMACIRMVHGRSRKDTHALLARAARFRKLTSDHVLTGDEII